MATQFCIFLSIIVILSISSITTNAQETWRSDNGLDISALKVANGDFVTSRSLPMVQGHAGAVVYTNPVTAHLGFYTSITWNNFGCQNFTRDRTQDYYDGFNFYISETDPNTSMDYYRQGFMYLPNTVTVGYNSYFQNEFYVCYWDTPPLYSANVSIPAPPPQAPFFRRYCKTFDAMSLPLSCNTPVGIYNVFPTIAYYPSVGIALTLGFGSPLATFDIPRKFRAYNHYVGLSAINTIRESSYHQFGQWGWDATTEITAYTLNDTRISALGQASVTTSTRRIWLTTSQKGLGLVLLRDYSVQLNQSFTFNFKWTLLGNADQSVAEGYAQIDHDFASTDLFRFALFLTQPRRELETLRGAFGGLGIQSRPNTTIIGFNSVLNEFYLCSWNVPVNDTLRNFCPTFPSPLPPIELNRAITFEVTYNQDLFEVYGNNELLFASKLVLDKSDSYTIGFAGASGNSSVRQYISEWSKTTVNSPNTNNNMLNVVDVKTFGGASVYRDTITMVNNGTCVAVYKTPLPARLGFTTSFQWKPTNCTSDSGFTFLLTTTPPSDITVSSDNNNSAGYGTSLLSRLISFSLNFTSSQFTAYFDSTLTAASTYSSGVSLPSNARCSDFIDVRIEYTNANLVRFYIMNQVVASISDTANTIINPSLYFFGLSGVEGTFTRWSATTTVLSNKRQFNYIFADAVINTLGTASVVNNALRLTTGGSESGVAYYPLPLYAHTGFHSTFTWQPTNCDAVNNGADGFTLFFSKDRPQFSDVYMSSGGLLGIGAVPNLTMIAYSATYNKFYVCNWTSPLTDNFRWVCNFVLPFSGPKMTCSNSYVFEHNFDGRVLTLAVNGAPIFTTQLTLDPAQYFVGLSGATGGGYFQQDVSNWTFDSTAV